MRIVRCIALALVLAFTVLLPKAGGVHAQGARQQADQIPQPCGQGNQGGGLPPNVAFAAAATPGAPGNPIVGPAYGYGGASWGRWGCDTIWTNSQFYNGGQGIFACYTVQGPDFISIDLSVPAYGWRNIGAYQDDGTGGCFFLGPATGALPGWRQLQLTDYGGFYGGQATIVSAYYYVP